jgi:diacylglycerol kinase family enzyme
VIQPFTVILNAASGKASMKAKLRLLRDLFLKRGLQPEIVFARSGADVRARAAEALEKGEHLLVVAGGDGTLSAAAGALIGSGAVLGILPFGTFNHLARDLGISELPEEAVEVILRGKMRQIDVGEVNGEAFLNNSSIGFYPRLVEEREHNQKNGMAKWAAQIKAFLRVVRKYPSFSLSFNLSGRKLVENTSFVFVGNNEYVLEGLSIGERTFDKGYLDIGIAKTVSRRELLRIFFGALFGTLDKEPVFDEYRVEEVRIDAQKPYLKVALDGEVKAMRTPLRYRIRRNSLKVLVP